MLTASDPTTVNCVMVNLTPNPPIAIVAQASAPTVVLSDGTNVQPSIAGATAEWIVERPRVPNPQPGQPPTAYNFADYGHTEFELCVAVEGDSVDVSSLSSGLPQELRGARRIRMFDVPRQSGTNRVHIDAEEAERHSYPRQIRQLLSRS